MELGGPVRPRKNFRLLPLLALICEAYEEETITDEKGKTETRTVLRFHPHMAVFYDETAAIGRCYRRQDEIGTPFGVTIDFDTLGENDPGLKDTVTLRERDSMEQTAAPSPASA